MLKNKTCDFCDTKAAVEIDKTFLCAKHYFKLPPVILFAEESVEVTPKPKKLPPNHWSVLLREIRADAGLTQRDLSRKTRMSQRTVADYENTLEPRQLSIYKVERLLAVLGYELDAVLVKKNV